MSVRQIPDAGAPREFPFGSSGSFTFDRTLDSGVYSVSLTGDDTFAASANALTISSPDGYRVPVSIDAGDGYVSLPFDECQTLHAASISTPSIASFRKIQYDQGAPATGVSVSFDTNYSGSYVVDATLPAGATTAYAYYANGAIDTLGTLPASVTTPTFDTSSANDNGSVKIGLVYTDAQGNQSKVNSASYAYPVPPGAFATGGTVYVSGGYRYHKFTSNGTLTVTKGGDIEYLVVAGGGSGGYSAGNNSTGGGGGGAGGMVSGSVSVTTGALAITIGGAGSNSSLGTSASAAGGGAGGNIYGQNGGSGGSGGGPAGNGGTAGTGIAGQGNNGGTSSASRGGGGGGKTATGGAPNGGAGSNALSTWATATSSGASGYYAGGGGGGASNSNGTGGTGGAGGGGNGGNLTGAGSAATANTGGGGGGSSAGNATGGAGGSGIVIVRYAI